MTLYSKVSEPVFMRVFLPMASVGDIAKISCELFAKFQTGFYSDSVDAVLKAFGIE